MTRTTRTCIPTLLSLLLLIPQLSMSFAYGAEPATHSEAGDEPLHVTVSKDSVNLRTSPDVHSKAAQIRLNKGDVLIVRHSSQPDWYEIQLPFPYKGLFIRQDMVTPDQLKK